MPDNEMGPVIRSSRLHCPKNDSTPICSLAPVCLSSIPGDPSITIESEFCSLRSAAHDDVTAVQECHCGATFCPAQGRQKLCNTSVLLLSSLWPALLQQSRRKAPSVTHPDLPTDRKELHLNLLSVSSVGLIPRISRESGHALLGSLPDRSQSKQLADPQGKGKT